MTSGVSVCRPMVSVSWLPPKCRVRHDRRLKLHYDGTTRGQTGILPCPDWAADEVDVCSMFQLGQPSCVCSILLIVSRVLRVLRVLAYSRGSLLVQRQGPLGQMGARALVKRHRYTHLGLLTESVVVFERGSRPVSRRTAAGPTTRAV